MICTQHIPTYLHTLLTHSRFTNSKTTFPENISNNQFCRYLYYMGRIGALQLDYSDAHTKLMQSSRKAPQNTALPFRIACQKLMIIVQLLLGEVPERSVFNQSGFRGPLLPYLQLTQAVRLGDLIEFNHAVEQVRFASYNCSFLYTMQYTYSVLVVTMVVHSWPYSVVLQ
jgi:26S proteasome regulatory subunit N3